MGCRFCVWDIGKVIYDFSFAPLDKWCLAHSKDVPLYETRRGKLYYNDYMRGEISFEQWCERLCDFYIVPFSGEAVAEINEAMHAGVSADFAVSRNLMERNISLGIVNCVLSNALKNLEDTGNFLDIVSPEHRFYSFNLGLLKPDAAIYDYVRKSLGCAFSEIIFIDDKIENIEGACALGINGILFDKETIKQKFDNLLRLK